LVFFARLWRGFIQQKLIFLATILEKSQKFLCRHHLDFTEKLRLPFLVFGHLFDKKAARIQKNNLSFPLLYLYHIHLATCGEP
jgi:hypothetical protein